MGQGQKWVEGSLRNYFKPIHDREPEVEETFSPSDFQLAFLVPPEHFQLHAPSPADEHRLLYQVDQALSFPAPPLYLSIQAEFFEGDILGITEDTIESVVQSSYPVQNYTLSTDISGLNRVENLRGGLKPGESGYQVRSFTKALCSFGRSKNVIGNSRRQPAVDERCGAVHRVLPLYLRGAIFPCPRHPHIPQCHLRPMGPLPSPPLAFHCR